MPAGRPTKYRPEYCDMVINHMAQGLSKESFAGVVGVWKEALYNWIEQHEEFSNAVKRGEALSRLYWENAGNDGMRGNIDGFNAASWVFNMKNRFGWRDKQEVTGPDGGALIVQVVRHGDD